MRKLTNLFYLLTLFIIVSCSKQTEVKQTEKTFPFEKKTGIPTGTQFTLRSLTSPTTSSTMTVTVTSASLLTVNTASSPKQPTDYFKIHYRDVTPSNFAFTVPTDGLDYWFIPFNAGETPSKLINGNTITISCSCSDGGVGKCEPKINVSTGEMWCDPTAVDGCSSGCCNTIYTNDQAGGGSGGGLIIQIDQVNFNGTTYN